MTIAGAVNSVTANTYFESAAEDLFSRAQPGFWQLFTKVVPLSGKKLGLEHYGPGGSMAELVGSRRWGGLREYLKEIPIVTYTTDPSLEIPSLDALGDLTGALKVQIDEFMAPAEWAWDKFATQTIIDNATCVDGVSLLNDAHPFGAAGATWDNKTTDALSFTSFNAGVVAMQKFQGENSEPLNIDPTHLMVGPELQRTALEIVGALRPVPFSASAQDASSSIVAATNFGNVYEGRVKVIVNRRITSTTAWYLMDLGKSYKPVAMGELEPLHGVAITNPESESMKNRSMHAYYIEGKAGFGAWVPQCIYGNAG